MQQLTGFVEVTQDALPACSVHYPRVLKGFLSRVQRASRISGPQSSPSSDRTAWSSSIRPSAVGRKGHTTPHHTRHDAHVMCVSGPRNVRPTPSWRQLLTPELELYVKLVLFFVRLRQPRNHAVDHLTRCRGR